MTEATTPHDAIFKAFLSRPETARDFIEIHLPPSLVKLCNLDTLHLESSSFVEENLRQYYNDVLYSVETTKGCGYIYVLIEHQSSPDENMAFRMLRYAIATMQRHLEAGHDYLPLVIPILFYQESVAHIHGQQTGSMVFRIRTLHAISIFMLFRWLILR